MPARQPKSLLSIPPGSAELFKDGDSASRRLPDSEFFIKNPAKALRVSLSGLFTVDL